MADVHPILHEHAAEDLQATYRDLAARYGHVPNFYAVLAHRPAVLKYFLPFYTAIVAAGTVERTYKELAYLKASLGNACAY